MIALLSRTWLSTRDSLISPVQKQLKAWQKANRKMNWGIPKAEFEAVGPPPLLTQEDIRDGFVGSILCYGFGDDGCGHADTVLSARIAWEYACRSKWRKTWQCEYIDFNRTDDIRLRPGAPPRPQGYYFVKLQTGEKFLKSTVSQIRKHLGNDTGCGPEGFQLLTVTHPRFQTLMNAKEMTFMALADFDVAPHGFNDFYDAPQLLCSNDTLGLGIGNIDQNYPLFGIPTLRF